MQLPLIASLIALAAAAPADHQHIRRANDLGHVVHAPRQAAQPYPTGTAGIIPTGTAPAVPMGTGDASCPVDGAVVCNGPNQFGLCNFGKVVWQQVAAGTACQNGQIVGTGIYAQTGAAAAPTGLAQ